MSKKRGKNRPPRIGPPQRLERNFVTAPCPGCSKFKDKATFRVVSSRLGLETVCGYCADIWEKAARKAAADKYYEGSGCYDS